MSVIDDYLRGVSEPERAELERIRHIVHQLAPEAEETITYAMPGFKYHGKYFLSFAAFKDHLSIFPASEVIEILKDRLAGYTLSKGTIQFTLEHPLPDALIEAVVHTRLTLMKSSS